MTSFTPLKPLPPFQDKSHHVGQPRTSFRNPWPSFPSSHAGIGELLSTRFGNRPPFIPVPSDRTELVQVLDPDLSPPAAGTAFKVTWIGHASFLVQCASPLPDARPMNILLDPVFSERTSPFTFFGPKRYTPTPCSLQHLLDSVPIDVVCISHNHYDHADTSTLKTIFDHSQSQNRRITFCVALGNPRWLLPLGIPREQIWEADWWDRIDVRPDGSLSKGYGLESTSTSTHSESQAAKGAITITATPCQHASARGPFDRDRDLWCSYVVELSTPSTNLSQQGGRKSLYFSGDTGYRTVPADNLPIEELDGLPGCPAFAEIGQQLGPFDLALLPIGLCHPRRLMSPVHCNPSDSICIHRDIKSKRSVGMHWGTVRGGLSQYYEDVRIPPQQWKEAAGMAGLKWWEKDAASSPAKDDWEIGLIAVGESLLV